MDENIKDLLTKHASFFKDQKVKNPKAVEDINDYTGFAFSRINRLIRQHKGNLNDIDDDIAEKKQIKNIDLLFSLVDPITKPITLYRGVKYEQFAKEDYSYVSTSYNMSAPYQYIDKRNHCCLMEITLPVGTKCLFVESVSNYSDEKEVLLPRNGNFVLTAVAKSQNEYDIDKYFITFLQNSAIFTNSLQDVVQKAEEKMTYLNEVLDTVKTTHLPPIDENYFKNQLLSIYPSGFYLKT